MRLQAVNIACALALGVQAQAVGQTWQEALESLTERGLGRGVLGIISNTVSDTGEELPRATESASLRQITSPRNLRGDPIQQFEQALSEMGWPVRLEGQIRRFGTPSSIGDTTLRFVRRSRDARADWRIAVAACR